MSSHTSSHTLPDLPYDYGDLEPVISAEIMRLHHTKHHQGYVQKLNESLEKYADAEKRGSLSEMVALQQSIRFNGGGHINHTLFWKSLCPPSRSQGQPGGKLAERLARDFGSFEKFQREFQAKTVAIQGSGWSWLGWSTQKERLEIACLPNQDPLSTVHLLPLFGVDVWEHAYYLQYQNLRPKYVEAIWSILDWVEIAKRWEEAT
ncbi:MAG: superoxide dismutase [Chlamydiota bacterium]